MAVAPPQQQYTIEEYLTMERAAEERHEYLDGEVYAMAGESAEHAESCTNLVRELRRFPEKLSPLDCGGQDAALAGPGCRAWHG